MLVDHVQDLHTANYACLSHCWGSDAKIVKTLNSNLRSHLTTGIEVDLLPKTSKEAVKICQRLSVVHLWIDSLCIIQD